MLATLFSNMVAASFSVSVLRVDGCNVAIETEEGNGQAGSLPRRARSAARGEREKRRAGKD